MNAPAPAISNKRALDVKEVDRAILACTSDNAGEGQLRRLAKAILRFEQQNYSGDPLVAIFNNEVSSAAQRLYAISVLRAYAANDSILSDKDHLIACYKLFDSRLVDVYSRCGITTRTQGYEKLRRLRDWVTDTERRIAEVSQPLRDLSGLGAYRNDLTRSLNSADAKALIVPFIRPQVPDVALQEVFSTAQAYYEQSTASRLQEYPRAHITFQKVLRQIDGLPTRYVNEFVLRPIQAIVQLVGDDFESNPLREPARIQVRPYEKKYPLGVPNAECDIVLIVENVGVGVAYDVSVKLCDAPGLTLPEHVVYLGTLTPRQSVNAEIHARVISPASQTRARCEATWLDYDDSHSNTTGELVLEGQAKDIEWRALARRDPYSLEPVRRETDLVGRDQLLDQMLSRLRSDAVGSFFVWGQKRVGKTSLVRTLASVLTEDNTYCVIYLDGGDYVDPDAAVTIQRLGETVCRRVTSSDARLRTVTEPTFDKAISPISHFLQQVETIAPEKRVVIILDEFDELPLDLYKAGPVGSAFFLSLRSISGKPGVGFVLVGGEKMEFIMNLQGSALNKFETLRVDYFDRERQWKDFQRLLRGPVEDWIEIADDAIGVLYEKTSGNPFFSKLVAANMFRDAVERRDSHVTVNEIRDAIERTVAGSAVNRFQHFWDDGIFETGDAREQESINRRKVLLAIAAVLRKRRELTRTAILDAARADHLHESMVESELRTFVRRGVLALDGDTYTFKVPLFSDWLRDRGVSEIITSFADPEATHAEQLAQERLRVRADEIRELTQKWGPYQGSSIGEDRVRAWLEQFGGPREQRLMFTTLQALRFYSGGLIRAKLAEAHGIVNRALANRWVGRPAARKRDDIIVSYIDDVGKSGAHCARLYAEENGIYVDRVIERGRLAQRLGRGGIRAVVCVDDIIGSGDSARAYLRTLAEECEQVLNEQDVLLFFVAVCGVCDNAKSVEEYARTLGLNVEVRVCDPLTDKDRAFAKEADIFRDDERRVAARELAYNNGYALEKRHPLGYQESELLIAFEHNCPNNTLPIIWKKKDEWVPLFARR